MEIQHILLIAYLAVAALVFTIAVDAVLTGGLTEENGRKASAIMSTFFLGLAVVLALIWPITYYVGLRSTDRDN